MAFMTYLNRGNKVFRLAEFTFLYAILAGIALYFRFETERVSPYWPATALLFAAFYVFERRDHFYIYALAYAAHITANLLVGYNFWISAIFATGNIVSTGLMYEYLRKTSPDLIELSSITSIVNLIFSGFVKSVIGSLFGAWAVWLVFGGKVNSLDVIRIWGLAEWSGLLLLTPAFFIWLKYGMKHFDPEAISTRKLVEGVALMVYFIITVMIAQSQSTGGREFFLKYLTIPGLIWALFRFNLHANYYMMLCLYVILNMTMVENLGIYAFRDEAYKNAILELNLFLSVIASISLFILASLNRQRRNFDELEANKQDLKDVFENAPIPYVILEGDGILRYCNNEFIKMLESEAVPLEGKHITQLMTAISAERFRGMIEDKDNPGAIEVSFVLPNDKTCLALVRLKRGKLDDTLCYCSVENLSQKKMVQHAARLAEERFRYLFNNSPEGVLVVDSNDGTIIDSNRIAQKFLNLRFRSRSGIVSLLGLDREKEDALYAALEKGEQFTFSSSFDHADDPRLHLEITANRITAEHGGFDVFLLRDITTQRRNERVKKLNRLRLEAMLHLRESIQSSDIDFLGEITAEAKNITDSKEAVVLLATQENYLVAHYTNSILMSSAFTEEEFLKSEIKKEWEILLTAKKPFVTKRAVRRNGVSMTEYLMGIPMQEDGTAKQAFGVVSDDEFEESDLDHFTLFSESIKSLFAKAAADVENRNLLLAVQQSTSSIVITDTYGRIKYVNPRFEEVTGYTFAEVKGQNPRVLKSGETTGDEYKKMWTAIAAGNTWRGFFHNRRKNGELFWESAAISPIKNEFGVITGYLAVKDDISFERQLEVDIARKEKRFSILWENSLDAMRLTDRNGIIVMANEAYAQLVGMPEAEIVGKLFTEYLESDFHDESLERYKAKFASGKIPQYQESLIHLRSGVIKWVNILSRFMESEDGEPILLSIFRDITDQKRKETELNEARMKAESMNQIKSTFLANMSHELRTPLINIMGYSEILMDELNDSEQREMLASILKGGERLKDTLDSILDLSNLEAQKTSALLAPHDLNQTAKKVCGEYTEAAMLKKLQLGLELSEINPVALVDEKLFYQVLDNLVNNAIKYTDSGWVKISTKVSGSGKNKSVFISVEDTGSGIKPDKMNVIFEPFRQGDEGIARNYEGAGLGLTIARKYVEMMGGELTVESVYGQGSLFTAGFIYSDGELESGEGSEPEASEKKLVLVVEDDISAANLINMYLSKFCEVIVVGSGDEALAILTEHKVDLMVIDINLPGSENGIELRNRIKSMQVYDDLPMVAVTAYTLPGDQLRFIEIGFSAFLEKPFKREEFINTILALL